MNKNMKVVNVNIIIYLIIFIICFLFLYLSNKLLGNLGLVITTITMNITSFILSFKYTTLSTINLNSNSICYITMLIALYLLIEKTNKEETRKISNLNFIINIFIGIMLYIMTYHKEVLTDTVSVNMKNIFMNNSTILITYPLTTLLSSHLLIIVYEKIKKLYDNYFITMVTIYLLVGLIEGLTYTFITYNKVLNTKGIIMILLSTYMIRLITTVIYSIILTITNKKKVKECLQ